MDTGGLISLLAKNNKTTATTKKQEEEEEEEEDVTLKDREVTSPSAVAPMSLALSDAADTGDSNGAVDDDICDACVG